jgi:hypothetical protein
MREFPARDTRVPRAAAARKRWGYASVALRHKAANIVTIRSIRPSDSRRDMVECCIGDFLSSGTRARRWRLAP